MIDSDSPEEQANFIMRKRVYENLKQWGVPKIAGAAGPNNDYFLTLGHLLGYHSWYDFKDHKDDPDVVNKIAMLAGDHGFTIYQAILARKEPCDDR